MTTAHHPTSASCSGVTALNAASTRLPATCGKRATYVVTEAGTSMGWYSCGVHMPQLVKRLTDKGKAATVTPASGRGSGPEVTT